MEKRTQEFSRNLKLETLLKEINENLWPAEQAILNRGSFKEFPLILVVGALRSGTTLLMQWLANTGMVCYPSNLLSRFYQAPILGAKIQRLLTDPAYRFRDEIQEFTSDVGYMSENGKTSGALAPNEFWYFWRRFFKFDRLGSVENTLLLRTVDIETLKSELMGIAGIFNKPAAFKGLMFNYNLGFFEQIFKDVIFIHIKRNPVYNIKSILHARLRQYGDINKWYSFIIKEFDYLKKLGPQEQAAGQVFFNNQAIEKSALNASNYLPVKYEEFCRKPENLFQRLIEILGDMGFASSDEYKGPNAFKSRDSGGRSSDLDQYQMAYEKVKRLAENSLL